MKVICIDNTTNTVDYIPITLGKVYDASISIEEEGCYIIKNDNNNAGYFYMWRFKKLNRKEKLERILNEI